MWTWDGTSSTAVAPALTPGRRVGHSMVWDAERGVAVLFGGSNSIGMPLDDTWLWDGVTWQQAHPAVQPSARSGAAMTFDPIRKVVVLFGGGELNDTWEWDGTTWQLRDVPTSPPPRSRATLAWNPARRRVVLFGGSVGVATVRNDAWEWDGTTWERVDSAQPPPARAAHSMVWMFDGLVVFGGGTLGCCGEYSGLFADMWQLSHDGVAPYETCGRDDTDGDGLVGCADPDCWTVCAPACEPPLGVDPVACELPRCGDTTCDPIEDCASCPDDCGSCEIRCGDLVCDPGETCAGECP